MDPNIYNIAKMKQKTKLNEKKNSIQEQRLEYDLENKESPHQSQQGEEEKKGARTNSAVTKVSTKPLKKRNLNSSRSFK